VIAEAKGEAERFEKVLQEYEKAPDVTRQRIFIDTMKEVMSKTDKIIIDKDGGGGVVPYLPLPELQKRQPTASSAPSAVPASPSLQTGGQQ
jgi:membrane protease subunit HflK